MATAAQYPERARWRCASRTAVFFGRHGLAHEVLLGPIPMDDMGLEWRRQQQIMELHPERPDIPMGPGCGT